MAGLVPAIHVFAVPRKQDVDARHKAGHDEFNNSDRWYHSFKPDREVHFVRRSANAQGGILRTWRSPHLGGGHAGMAMSRPAVTFIEPT
jgi:hypothetical protein